MTLQGIFGFTNTQVRILVDDGYDSQQLVLHQKFTDIKDWCQLEVNIPAIRSGVYYRDSNIKLLQALAWWVTDLTLRGKTININNFKTDFLADFIEESCIDFEDTRHGKGEMRKPKQFSHEKWAQLEDSIYNYFTSRKKSLGVPISYVTRKDAPNPEDSKNRNVLIIYQASLSGNIFTRDSRKVINIIKELSLGTDAETWIKGIKCGRNEIQELQNPYDSTPEGARRRQVSR